ncbi:hypothetical protein [Microbacterium sp. CR_7]|uniref:hypothetical protein n=1 Tax=Microbacterium sp. CR_7 TaxID=3055792 RepID=UPI0035C0BA11
MYRRIASVAAALIIGVAVSAPAPALAASDPPAVCTVGGVAVPDGVPLPEEIPTVISCFDTVAEAEQFIADGAPGDLEQLPAPAAAARSSFATASTVIVGKAYTGTSRGGTALIHWGSGSGCYGVTFGFPTLAATWNNNVYSAEGLSNCWSSQYDGTSYTGSKITCTPYCATLGALAGKTSSIVYRPVGSFG